MKVERFYLLSEEETKQRIRESLAHHINLCYGRAIVVERQKGANKRANRPLGKSEGSICFISVTSVFVTVPIHSMKISGACDFKKRNALRTR
ncbi:hypothetical protein [Marinithermofilum abyssi]|uniref:hypothetical protein n=1 Tax=Marinithermofilum abyssi TaxID=1571185 RepID=UPI00166E00B6|nr:hypothetical protein [Marinithermofilum abyssi]